LVTPVPLSPLLLLCCAYGGGSIRILLQAMPYRVKLQEKGLTLGKRLNLRKRVKL
jgi:hypothetical protein